MHFLLASVINCVLFRLAMLLVISVLAAFGDWCGLPVGRSECGSEISAHFVAQKVRNHEQSGSRKKISCDHSALPLNFILDPTEVSDMQPRPQGRRAAPKSAGRALDAGRAHTNMVSCLPRRM